MKELQTVLNNILADKNTNLKPENLKKNVTCLGVTGTLEASASSGGVKQFSTVEEMNSSTGNTEGDLAIVYRSEVQNATVDSRFQVATFPDTVVLDTALTDYVEVRYRAVDSSVMFDCMGQLDSSMFSMDCYTESGSVRITYESSDGITYTRTDTTGNPVDFGTEIYYEMAERWNDAIGKFIQIGGSTFEGLYKYNENNWVLAPSQLTATSDDVYTQTFYGKDGAEIGTLQNKENLTTKQVQKKVEIWNNFNEGIICPEDMTDAFKDMTITAIPELNTSNVNTMIFTFIRCTNLATIPLIDTSNVTNAYGMFHSCSSLITIPPLDMSNNDNTAYMFYDCINLISAPLSNANNLINTRYMFCNCKSITEIPQLNTSKVITMNSMFYGCIKLTTLPQLDATGITANTGLETMFYNCPNLSDESLNNILLMCANFSGYTGTKTLKHMSLTEEQATKCTTLSNYQAFLDAGWTTGY